MLATEFPFVVSELSYDKGSVFHKQGKASVMSHIMQLQNLGCAFSLNYSFCNLL